MESVTRKIAHKIWGDNILVVGRVILIGRAGLSDRGLATVGALAGIGGLKEKAVC